MKKLIFIIATLGIVNSSIFPATFTLKYGATPLSSKNVYIYQNGKQITSGYTTSLGTVSFTLPTGNYSYKTETNYSGDITATSTLTLDHKKLSFTVKDNSSVPISSETIIIYENGIQVTSLYTNSAGLVEFYLKPSDQYAYMTNFGQAAVSLLNDVALNLTQNKVRIIAKYLNYPIADYFSIYSYGDKNTSLATSSSSTTNGEINFNISTGKYWLKNNLNVFTELNITDLNQSISLDYKKVHFVSNELVPNILTNIIVSNGNYSTNTKITDGKGFADFYLLPGTYTYSHLGMSESFTVTNDMTINLTTQTVTFNLKNAVTLTAYVNQPFKIGKDMNSLSSYTTNSSGLCEVKLKAGSYIFSDGISSYSFTVSSGGQTITPPLYDVTFNITQNLPYATLSYLYVSSINTGKEVTYTTYTNGMKLCLLSGDYKFHCYGDGFSSIQYVPFQVTQNTTVQGLYTFQLNITDNNSTAVSGQTYYIKQDGSYINYSFTTNNQGSAIAYLPNGSYQLYNTTTQEEIPFVINNQNQTLNFQLPDVVTLAITKNGVSFSGYLMIYNELKTNTQMILINNGIGKARLSTGNNYFVSLITSGVSSVLSKITVSGTNQTLDFASVQIKTQGKGLAFPYQTDENSVFYALNGSIIRLAAEPMQGWICKRWDINSTSIIDDMIDCTINGSTIATAIFEQVSGAGISNAPIAQNLELFPSPAENQISFSDNLNGNAVIYNSEGKVVKQFHIYGNGISISDLNSGLYVVVIETNNGTFKGNFIKK